MVMDVHCHVALHCLQSVFLKSFCSWNTDWAIQWDLFGEIPWILSKNNLFCLKKSNKLNCLLFLEDYILYAQTFSTWYTYLLYPVNSDEAFLDQNSLHNCLHICLLLYIFHTLSVRDFQQKKTCERELLSVAIGVQMRN